LGEIQYFVVDYDIKLEPHKRRRMFYRKLHALLMKHGLEADRSTASVWIMDSRGVAEEIFYLAKSFGSAHWYEASRID